MAEGQSAGRQVVRVEEFLPYPGDSVWHVLTAADLVARWLGVDGFRLEPGHSVRIETDPVRRVGMGGAGRFEVLAFERAAMLRISWRAPQGRRRGLDSTVTFTLTAEGRGTRLLIEHDGRHPCGFSIGTARLRTDGCQTSARRVGEVAETLEAWRACVGRIGDLLYAAAQPESARQEGQICT